MNRRDPGAIFKKGAKRIKVGYEDRDSIPTYLLATIWGLPNDHSGISEWSFGDPRGSNTFIWESPNEQYGIPTWSFGYSQMTIGGSPNDHFGIPK